MFKTKKGKYQLSFFSLVRAQGLAALSFRCHGAHSLMLTGVLKSAFRLWSNPFPRVLSLMALKTKNSHSGVFFVLVRAQGLAALSLRRHGAHSLMLTGVLKSAFRLWSNPFSRVLSLMALKTKNSQSGVFFCFGTRAGIRTLDPLIKSQLL